MTQISCTLLNSGKKPGRQKQTSGFWYCSRDWLLWNAWEATRTLQNIRACTQTQLTGLVKRYTNCVLIITNCEGLSPVMIIWWQLAHFQSNHDTSSLQPLESWHTWMFILFLNRTNHNKWCNWQRASQITYLFSWSSQNSSWRLVKRSPWLPRF